MRQIADWLGQLGLGQYAQRFTENDINFAILPDLTDQDLKELGVSSLGHRRQLLRAIAEIDGTPTAAAPATAAAPPPAPTPSPTTPPLQEAAGERRYLTVMFCDLVGSTAISAQLDAEEWRDLVGAYLDAASAAVTEMGGHVAKKLGDGLMSLFGYPVAQENDSERAVRAALSIQRALAELNRNNASLGKPSLTARIGLETGPVVVDAAGEIYGDGAGAGRTGRGSSHGAGTAPGCWPVRRRGARQPRAEGRARASDFVPTGAGNRRRTPLGPAQSHAADWSRRGNCNADATLGTGASGRWPAGNDCR